MEFAVGIPGSIGGAVYMNAGAYDGEMQNIVNCVKVMDLQGNERVLTAEELNFGYRKTSLKNSGLIVTEVTLKCLPVIKMKSSLKWMISVTGVLVNSR